MGINIFVEAAKDAHNFVEVGAFAEVLAAFGDVEHAAAHDIIADLNLAEDKRAQVFQAITHLQSAHHAYEASIGKATHGIKEFTTAYSVRTLFRRAICSYCLLALCYRYVGERSLMENTIDRAIALDKSYIGNRQLREIGFKIIIILPVMAVTALIALTLSAPAKIWRAVRGKSKVIPPIGSVQLLAFKAAMISA